MHNTGRYWLQSNCPYTQQSAMSIRSCHSFPTVHWTISNKNRIYYNKSVRLKGRHLNLLHYTHHRPFFPMDSIMWRFPSVRLTASLLQLLEGIDSAYRVSDRWRQAPYIEKCFNPYPTAFPYGNGMVLHFYQQQESSTTKSVHKVINKGLKTYV